MSTFERLANSRAFSNLDEPDFAGVCYAWAWAALDSRLSSLVDVEGPASKRGLWIAGEWLSRADLGNWLMALLAGLSQGAGEVMWFSPEAEDLLEAALGYLMEGGIGFRADIGPALESPSEIWFQPFVGADVVIERVPPRAAGILLGAPPPEVENSVYGPHLDFFVGRVLARGVPGVLRDAFEREPALRRPGPIAMSEARKLAERYPTIANAYAPDQWARHFGARGLDARAFGAT